LSHVFYGSQIPCNQLIYSTEVRRMPDKEQKSSGNVELAVRGRLLDAAIRSFAALGFEGASLRMIAQQAGVAFQLISYYFGTKEDLWMAAVNYLFEERMKSARATFSPARDYEDQLREWVRIAISFSIQEPELRQILCQECLARSKRYDSHLKPLLKDSAPYFSFFFDQAAQLSVRPRLSTKEALLVLRGIMVLSAVAPDEITSIIESRLDSPRTIDVLVDFVVNLFLRGQGTPALERAESETTLA
jgi:AcrR family transcriptional regulator